MKKSYTVDLEKQDLIFSAAHFITFGDNICESLHGHNYRIRCVVTGELNEHQFVVDFVALQQALKNISKSLDHRMLLARDHPTIKVQQGEAEIEVQFEDRRWVFPLDNCVVLPIGNTTAEQLAAYIGQKVIESDCLAAADVETLEVFVDENEGQWGACKFDLSQRSASQ